MNIQQQRRAQEQAGAGHDPAGNAYEDEAETFSFASLIQTVWDNRWLLAATTGVGLGIGGWYIATETPLYTASAEVVLELQQENVVSVESVVPERSLSYLTVNTELRVLKSHELMRSTVDALSLEDDPEFNPAIRPPPKWKMMIDYDGLRELIGLAPETRPAAPTTEQARETATGILRSKVSVSTVPNTLIFKIATETQEPGKSATIANTIAEHYIDAQRDSKFASLDEAMEWLGKRVVELKTELEAAEAEIEDFSTRASMVREETLLANTQRLKSMRARRGELTDTAAKLRQRVERLEALRANSEFAALAKAVDDPQVRAAASALAGPENEAAPPSATPDASALARFDALFEGWLDGLRADAERAEGQAAAAGRSVSELAGMVESQSADLVTLRQMQREAEATRLIYQSFLGRLKEITVQQGIQQADSSILSRATRGGQSHPDARGSLTRAGVAGLVLGFVLIAMRSILYSAVRTPEEVEAATGVTVLGAIPEDRIQQADKLLDRIAERPASRIAEAVRNMRTAIQLSNIDMPPTVVVVTSSVPEEGKSILAAALGHTTAMSGKKVLLVETDLRRRVLREYFHIEPGAGLVGLLSGQTSFEETVQRDARTGLDLLIADDKQVTPVDLFGSRQFASFLAEAREHYELIVLDTPPVLAVPETRVIAQHADAIIYVVRWNDTKRRMIQTGLDLLRQVHVRVTGIALTRVDRRRMDRYGYYGYGAGPGSKMLKKYYAD